MTHADALRALLLQPPTREEVSAIVADLACEEGQTLSSAKGAANELRRVLSEGGRDVRLSDLSKPLSRPDRAKPWCVRVQLWRGDLKLQDTSPHLGDKIQGWVGVREPDRAISGLPGVAKYISECVHAWAPDVSVDVAYNVVFGNVASWRQSLYKYSSTAYRLDISDDERLVAYIVPAEENTK